MARVGRYIDAGGGKPHCADPRTAGRVAEARCPQPDKEVEDIGILAALAEGCEGAAAEDHCGGAEEARGADEHRSRHAAPAAAAEGAHQCHHRLRAPELLQAYDIAHIQVVEDVCRSVKEGDEKRKCNCEGVLGQEEEENILPRLVFALCW